MGFFNGFVIPLKLANALKNNHNMLIYYGDDD